MHYIVIGAGPAGVTAAETLRSLDPAGRITLIGGEPEPPYSRMAIPYLLVEQIDEGGTYLRKDDDHHERNRMMTISKSEFLRSLTPLERHYRIEIDETAREVNISHRFFSAVLQLHENKPVVLGSLSMPSLEVLFKFENSAVDEIKLFLQRFDLCFRRGGG